MGLGPLIFISTYYLLIQALFSNKKNSFYKSSARKKKLEIIVVNWFESIFDVTKVCLKNQSKPWLREMAPRRRRELAIFTLQHSNFDYFHTALWIQAQKRVLYELEKNLQTGVSFLTFYMSYIRGRSICFRNHTVVFFLLPLFFKMTVLSIIFIF